MSKSDLTESSPPKELPRWDRSEATATLEAFEEKPPEQSQRQFARDKGVARGTLQHWLSRKAKLDVDPLMADFLESPRGLAFVHQLVAAALFVFTQVGPCGVRLMCLFLQLSGLNRVVASSRGSQHEVSVQIQELIGQFGRSERERLGSAMEHKVISAAQDENFHSLPCLVAIEPLSGFILLERYSERRDGKSWTAAMAQATAGLSVEIALAVGDEAKGLLAHARDGLGVPHAPDLFHVQQDLGHATGLALGRRTRQAAEQLVEARKKVARHIEQRDAYRSAPHGPGKPPGFEKRIAEAQAAEHGAKQALQEAEQRLSEAREARRAISALYHPFDLGDGRSRTPEQLERGLKEQFGHIEQVAAAAGLSQSSHELIAKARRLIPSMVATVAFFFGRIKLILDSLQLEGELDGLVRDRLVPALYLARVAEQASTAERKAELRDRAQQMLAEARAANGPLQALPEEQRRRIEEAARHCAEAFVRSSSCVEGRNGQLSLRHHGLHRLSGRKLAALTTIHNYFLRRADDTTAAGRFFGSEPQDLFEWILDRLNLPARPARARPCVKLRAS